MIFRGIATILILMIQTIYLVGIEKGRWSYGEPEVLRWGEETKLKIGNFCSISGEVNILLGDYRGRDT